MSVPHADLRIDAGWIVPVRPTASVLANHSLLVRDGRIAALLPTLAADGWSVAEHVRLPDHVLIPGLVNLHTHAAMNLLRGYADDLPLMTWLSEHIWPAEGRHVSPAFVRDGTRLACLEMLKGGVTCFNDMYFFPEATAEAAVEAGIRIAAGLIVVEAPTPYAADPDDYLAKGLAARDAWRDHALVQFCLAPHAPYTVGDRALEKIVTYAAQLDLPIHMHVHETEDEIRHSLEHHGVRPLARLRALGVLGPNLTAVHAVHLNDEEIDSLAAHGCHVAHCPASNLKLASGFAPVARLLAAGINVGVFGDAPGRSPGQGRQRRSRHAAGPTGPGNGYPGQRPGFGTGGTHRLTGNRQAGRRGGGQSGIGGHPALLRPHLPAGIQRGTGTGGPCLGEWPGRIGGRPQRPLGRSRNPGPCPCLAGTYFGWTIKKRGMRPAFPA